MAAWNISFKTVDSFQDTLDINGGLRGTVVATTAFRTGVHYWEVTVADMRTLCIGVTEMPRNPRTLCDKWLGEIGFAVSCSSCSGGTAFLWSKDQLSTTTVKGFAPGQCVGLLLDMEERTLEYYLDGQHAGTAFTRLPPGPLYPACSNGFDKAFARRVTIKLELPVPRDYFKFRETRRAERAKQEAQAATRTTQAPPAGTAAAAPAAAPGAAPGVPPPRGPDGLAHRPAAPRLGHLPRQPRSRRPPGQARQARPQCSRRRPAPRPAPLSAPPPRPPPRGALIRSRPTHERLWRSAPLSSSLPRRAAAGAAGHSRPAPRQLSAFAHARVRPASAPRGPRPPAPPTIINGSDA